MRQRRSASDPINTLRGAGRSWRVLRVLRVLSGVEKQQPLSRLLPDFLRGLFAPTSPGDLWNKFWNKFWKGPRFAER